ncbi:MAG TPA: hypothetical protein VFP26_13830 [Gemmatimonadaceae bacterium]|nr:hypothetical protein [Gemmatimonadaceae bacterium]
MKLASPRRSFLARWMLFAALIAITASGCTLNVGVNDPAVVVKHAGDGQAGPTNTALPVAFEVLVLDQFGNSLKNVVVDWTIVSGGGSLSETSNKTVEGGVSSVTYTTGPTAGTAQIQAKAAGIPPVTFSVTIT